ncbi:MAG: TIGR03016 family PEP-CTERM system-associated outer membrane protein [Rubrivivax sp.]|nr:TIGR03016 family PEP-CTERM system-associated outer membrane protein [Rubrivivax sp.]
MNRRRNGPTLAPPLRPTAIAAVLVLVAWPAVAQESAGRRFTVTPTFTASETYTETDSGQNRDVRDGEFVTRLSPGLRIASRAGRVQGSLDYTLNATWYSKTSEAKSFDNALSAAFLAEAVENRFFIDARASISRQSLSPYGRQSADDRTRYNDNRTEVATVTLSPYLVGPLGNFATWQLRYNASLTETSGGTVNDSLTYGPILTVSSASSGALVGWSLLASQQTIDFKGGRATEIERVNAQVFFRPDPDLQLSVNGGQERTNVGSAFTRTYDNWGAGLRWTPTPRTTIALQGDERYYGRGHSVLVEHRMRRSVVRYTDSRDSTSGADATGVGQPVTLYQLLFLQFASVQPDPALRDQLVRDFLRAIGRDPNELVAGGLLGSAVSLQQRRDLSWALLGVRTTLNLQAYNSTTRILDNPINSFNTDPVKLWGYSATVSHRLTPTSSVSLTGSRQIAKSSGARPGNDLKSMLLAWSGRVSTRTSVGLSARYSVFDSVTDPYREAAVTASITMVF